MHQTSSNRLHPKVETMALIVIGFLYAAYFVLRYGGLWAENDTAVFTQVTRSMLQAKSVLFAGQYTHGFGYPTWLGTLSLLTGLNVSVMNTIIMPFIGVILLLVTAFVAYHTFLKSSRLAMLSVLLLFAVPDLMFTVLRGNHEKLNIALMLMALVALFRSFEVVYEGNWRAATAWIMLFYTFAFINATVNDYFASTFAVASTITLIAGAFLINRNVPAAARYRGQIVRLTSYVGATWLLVWWVMLYVFPPAGHDFQLLHGAITKITNLFLTLHTSSNPYSAPSSQWSGYVAQFLVASFRWVLFLLSLLVWVQEIWRLVFKKQQHRTLEHLFLLALYGAFGFLVAIAIPLDFTGMNAGTNLEVRNFPYFALMASPLLVWGLAQGYRRLSLVSRRKFAAITGGLLSLFILIGLFKSTLDPAISNQWMFYTPAEKESLTAFDRHSIDATLWSGPDNRLVYANTMLSSSTGTSSQVTGYHYASSDQDILISPEVIESSMVQHKNIPPYQQKNCIYDNGQAQIYRTVPQTLFQNGLPPQ